MYVLDATPLIYLAKAERIEVVGALDDRAVMPEPVYGEVVVTGTEEGYADARRVERAVEDGVVEVVALDDVAGAETETYPRLRRNDDLSGADAVVLAVADATDGVAVMDEQYGRAVADAEGIETRGTAYVVLRALRDGAIGVDDARETIDAMVNAGWYCAPDVYARVLAKIDELA